MNFWEMGRENNTKSVKDLLLKAQRLKRMSTRANQLAQFNIAFLSKLPSMLSQYCQVCDYQNGVLTVETTSNAVATQLRFTAPQLLGKLRQQHPFQRLSALEIRVAAPQVIKQKRRLRPNSSVSTTNREMIRETAQHIATDESTASQRLAASLTKLATTLDKLGKK